MTDKQYRLLLLLNQIDKICRDNGICYSLHGGTLLGSIREKGFISWDNDADISFTRNEYNKFNKIAEKLEDYILIDKCIGGPILFYKKNEEEYATIDIFIYDYISEKKIEKKIKIYLTIILQAMLKDNRTIRLLNYGNHNVIEKSVYLLFYHMGKLINKNKKKILLNDIIKNRYCGNRKYIYKSNDTAKYLKEIIPYYYMNNYIDVNFANKTLMISSYYDKILSNKYGSDYLIEKYDKQKYEQHEKFIDIVLKQK